MSARTRDLEAIPTNELTRLSVDELVRVIAMARRSEDPDSARRARTAIEVLLAVEFDRIKGIVISFRFPGHGEVRIAESDHDDAVQAALERVLKMLENFRGESVGQWRAALRTTVNHAMMDFSRRTMNREKGLGKSLDEKLDTADGESLGRYDDVLAEIARTVSEVREAFRDEMEIVAKALERIPNEDMREVLRRTWLKEPSKQIADDLELSVDNVDQLRFRGQKKLQEIMEEMERSDRGDTDGPA